MAKIFGLANVGVWAFPLNDEGWVRLRELPVYKLVDGFSNNAPDSQWLRWDPAKVEYIGRKLAEDGKFYRLTLIDRNWSLRIGEEKDNDIRTRILLGLKNWEWDVWRKCMDEVERLVLETPGLQYMVWNGSEGKDNIDRGGHKFVWDTNRTTEGADKFEILVDNFVKVQAGDYRHRYWAKNPDGSIYRHYHRNIHLNATRRIYQETGVHDTFQDDAYWLRKQYNSLIKYADEWWWHGVVDLRADEVDPVKAWDPSTVSSLSNPKKRSEYHGLMKSETGAIPTILDILTKAKSSL